MVAVLNPRSTARPAIVTGTLHPRPLAAEDTITAPVMVSVMESRNPMCGGDSSTASKPYKPCHHWSHKP